MNVPQNRIGKFLAHQKREENIKNSFKVNLKVVEEGMCFVGDVQVI
jgi:hypothetical protein